MQLQPTMHKELRTIGCTQLTCLLFKAWVKSVRVRMCLCQSEQRNHPATTTTVFVHTYACRCRQCLLRTYTEIWNCSRMEVQAIDSWSFVPLHLINMKYCFYYCTSIAEIRSLTVMCQTLMTLNYLTPIFCLFVAGENVVILPDKWQSLYNISNVRCVAILNLNGSLITPRTSMAFDITGIALWH